MAPPQVSVIVPAYGVAHLLGEALASLQAQTCADFEAIVIDDGAPDDVAAAFAPFAQDPRFRLLRTDNRGVSAARNRAVAEARAPVLAMLDGDDAWEPDYLERMLPTIAADARLGFVTCDARFVGAAEREGRRFSDLNPQEGAITVPRLIARAFNVFTGCVVRLAAFDGAGGYDESLRAAEDLDLWIRILASGWEATRVPLPLVRYRVREGSLSADGTGLRMAERRMLAKLAQRFAGRPEGAAIDQRLDELARQDAWAEGEALLMAGRVRAGLDQLAGLPVPSLRWRIALPVMRAAPLLVAPLLRLRPRLPAPSRRAS